MSLSVYVSRSRDFALQAFDRSIAALDPETLEPRPHPAPPTIGPKVWQVSDWALVGAGGCVVRLEHLRVLLAERISRDDDIDACMDALSDAYSAMCANPAPGWEHDNGTTSIPGGPFNAHINGFRRDGRMDFLQLWTEANDEFHTLKASGDVALCLGAPSTASAADLAELELATPLDLELALEQVMHIHRFFRDKYPEVVSEGFDVSIIRWDPEQLRPVAAPTLELVKEMV